MNRQRHYEDYQRARKKGQEGAKKKDAGSRSAWHKRESKTPALPLTKKEKERTSLRKHTTTTHHKTNQPQAAKMTNHPSLQKVDRNRRRHDRNHGPIRKLQPHHHTNRTREVQIPDPFIFASEDSESTSLHPHLPSDSFHTSTSSSSSSHLQCSENKTNTDALKTNSSTPIPTTTSPHQTSQPQNHNTWLIAAHSSPTTSTRLFSLLFLLNSKS